MEYFSFVAPVVRGVALKVDSEYIGACVSVSFELMRRSSSISRWSSSNYSKRKRKANLLLNQNVRPNVLEYEKQ